MAKKILSLKPFSKTMKALECVIYKKRMATLVEILGKERHSFEPFASDQLKLSLAEFLELKNNCIQEVPLDEISKKHMNKISEIICIKQIELRQAYEAYKKPIQGKSSFII